MFRAIALLTSLGMALSAQVNLNKVPSRAIGHPQLTVATRNPNLVEGRELYAPQAVALDNTVSPPIIYVSDLLNNRVLGWKNATGFSNGAKADLVIGQKDFFSTQSLGPGTAFTSGLFFPTGLAVDRNGNVFVIDNGNNRILRYPKPYAHTEQLPDLVIGQTSLSCNTCNLANSGGISARTIKVLGFTSSLLFDGQGNLWFTDSGNNRVLRYPASALGADASNTPAADLVLGQPDFTSNSIPDNPNDVIASKSVLSHPGGMVFDPAGRLYVSDSSDRVLVYQPNLSPAAFDNGRAALRIMGVVPVPKGNNPPLVPTINGVQFSNPSGVFMVGSTPGVVDSNHHRLVLFDPFEQWPADGSSPNARAVVGQSSFQGIGPSKDFAQPNRGVAEPRAISFNAPSFALATSNELFVADSGNNRVLVLPTGGLGPNSAATRVLGQDDFTFGAPNLLEGREMNFGPAGYSDGGVLVDLVSAVPHLYVADSNNNRVLGFLDARTVRPGDKADLVIGQPDFQRSLINYPTNDATRPSAQSLFLPVGLALDTDGNLFVADTGNGRVLRFPKPFDRAQRNNPSADLVLGQAGFNSSVSDPTQRTMHSPYGLAFTSDGGLLVSDSFHNRVLFFAGSAFINGQPASKVFGQADYGSFLPGNDTNQMAAPKHIATDSDDRLYVADEANGRILIFDQLPYTASANARAATVLLGQNTQSGFSTPRGIFVSKITGEIWTIELGNTRLMRFPKYDDLTFQQNASDFQIPSNAGVAVAQDSFGDVFVAEFTNRIAIYYPGLAAVNAANAIPGRALAPGSVATVNRQGAPFTTDNTAADPAKWPTDLADIQVVVNNSPAPISFVSPDSLNFLMPMSTPSNGSVEVQVLRKSSGQILGIGQVDMAPASPALFTRNGFGVGQLVATNSDGMPNEPSHPIGRGKVVSLFGTGQGYVPGAPPDGLAAGGQIATDIVPRVLLGTQFVDPANVMYSGLAPGQVGVWQIDVKIPDFVAPSAQVQVVVQLKSINSSVPPQVQTIAVSQQ